MSKMVEQVARALAKHADDSFEDAPAGFWEDFARAAIAAMREPTEAMVKEGNKYTDWASGADDAWEVMIDEALK